MAKRYTRKELRRPDEFITFWQHAYEVLRKSARPILVGLGVVLVTVVGSSALSKHSDRLQGDASKALSRAMKLYTTDLVTDEEAGKKAQGEDDIPRFHSVDDRRKATLAALDEIRSKYAGSASAREAELVRASVLFD